MSVLRFLLLALRSTFCLAVDAAMSFAVSQKGMDYAAMLAKQTLNARTQSVSIPDIALKKSGWEFNLKNIVFENVRVADAKLSTSPGNMASLALNGISFHSRADWSYKLIHWPHVPSGHGTVVLQIGGSSGGHASVSLEQRDGKPHVTSKSVALTIQITALHFHGGIQSDILTLFKGPVRMALESGLQGPVKGQITSLINVDANRELTTFSLVVPLGFPAPLNIAEIDFALLQVSSTSTCAALALKGEAYQIGNHTEAPLPAPVGLPAFDQDLSTRMAEVLLHPYALESLGAVFVDSGVAKLDITNDMWPKGIPLKLDTTTLITTAPSLYRKYPRAPLRILAKAVGPPPTIDFKDDGSITVNGKAAFDFHVVPKPGEDQYAFTVGCPLTASVEMAMTNETITGKLQLLSCPLELIENDTGGRVYVAPLAELVTFAITSILVPFVNKEVSSGYPLPTFHGVTFHNSAVATRGGFLVVSSDILYQPSLKRPVSKAPSSTERVVLV